MPVIEIVLTDTEMKMLNNLLEISAGSAISAGTIKGAKKQQQTISNIHNLMSKYITEAYELGKVIGDAGLD